MRHRGGGGSEGGTTLRHTHQWPEATAEEGDFRSVIAQRFEEQTGGDVTVQISPNSSLVEPTEQYDSMIQGATDMSVFPLDYGAGNAPAFSIIISSFPDRF